LISGEGQQATNQTENQADGTAAEDAGTASTVTVFGVPLDQAVALVGTIASALAPQATVAGLSLSTVVGIAKGVAQEIPAAIQAVEDIKATVASNTAPTDEQWAAWNAAADSAHAAAQAAQDEVLAGDGT
jgi:hypothetical protein